MLRDEWQLEVPLQRTSRGATRSPTRTSSTRSSRPPTRPSTPSGRRSAPSSSRPSCAWCCCKSIDSHWREHLAALDYLRQGIHLRGYAQKNPKQEYKREAFELFSQLLDVVKMEVTRVLMTVRIQTQEQVAQAAEAIEEQASSVANVTYTHPNEDGSVSQDTDLRTLADAVPKVGRNEPCPCGSGKKYKQCHGRLA